MSVLVEQEAVRLTLSAHADCVAAAECRELAAPLYELLSNGNYNQPVSLLALADFDDYLADHRTARKRAAHAERLGYSFASFERADFEDDIYRINTSLPSRQGRPMSRGYTERVTFSPLPAYPCARHRIDTYGVFSGSTLVAYLVLYTAGNMAMISQILGHGAHLGSDIMYLLAVGALRRTPRPITVFYNRHDSGTDGLRFFKERLGFHAGAVEWVA